MSSNYNNNNNNYYYTSYWDYFSIPLPLCSFILILFFMLGFSWYINYENKFEDLIFQVKLFLMIVPLLLLLAVHCLSSGGIPFLIPFPEQDSLHRAGGSPWGVAVLLVFLFFMISYQSSLHERWFPLISR
ncbi:hypothetical protein CsatB_015645 [Cannabis sativa]